MNVLNVSAVERELHRCACYARHSAAQRWVETVARNYILSDITIKDREANFVLYTGQRHPAHIEMPRLNQLAPWADAAMKRSEPIFWFDTVQVRRRNLWQAVEQIVHWFNGWPVEDKRLPRLSRIDFETAASAAAMWFSDVQTNLWDYVKDTPPVVYRFKDNSGYHWVKMVTPLHFERESRMMKHCVGNGAYYGYYKAGHNEYYSLRDKGNAPHATMEVALIGHSASMGTVPPKVPCVAQCKGKGNAKPDARYQCYIYSFVTAQNWRIEGDNSNIDKTVIVDGEEHKAAPKLVINKKAAQ